ncbi:hypothetical protein BT69DRAFT_1242250 [Atractiella rhizophila]|nr:hypothetical protein BT69DRAFT_1242250 [Atractiella rhizophila]
MENTSPTTKAPTFFPPLWLQRRTFVLNTIRASNIRSVLDLGCGSGTLLAPLCQPAFHLDDFPPFDSHECLKELPEPEVEDREIHTRRLNGVDTSSAALELAKETAKPVEELDDSRFERWEDMTVQIWKGEAEVYNENLDGHQLITSLQLIEHLHEPAFNKLPRTVLSIYRPSVWIVTTPNYAFNSFFPPTFDLEFSAHRCPDPTGRTDRVFRNEDHKFEWYPSEFAEWARTTADRHDYDVTLTGVGDLGAYYGELWTDELDDQFKQLVLQDQRCGTEEERKMLNRHNFFATQIAVFQPVVTNEPARSPRSTRTVPLPFLVPSVPLNAHQLLVTYQHRAHRSADHPLPHTQIRDAVKTHLHLVGECSVSLRDLWSVHAVRQAAGGRVNEVLDAVNLKPWNVTLAPSTEDWRRGMDKVIISCEESLLAKEEEAAEDIPEDLDPESDDYSASQQGSEGGYTMADSGWGSALADDIPNSNADVNEGGWPSQATLHGGKVDRIFGDDGGWGTAHGTQVKND